MKVAKKIRSLIKDASLKTGVYDWTLFNVYPYMYDPSQLAFLTECVKAVRGVPGCFVEAGCAYGATTVFLNKAIDEESLFRDYYAIDTFSGFVKEHMDYETEHRGKPNLNHYFTQNKKSWFDKSMALYGYDKRVRSVESDVAKFDFSAIAPIAFCLLDVDLYKPIQDVLPKIYKAMSPGGVIVVDDCTSSKLWDGAFEACQEFVKQESIPVEIVAKKLGVIRVTA